MMRTFFALALGFGLLSACGDNNSSVGPDFDAGDAGAGVDALDVDSLPVFDCWPSIEPIPRGTVALGKGGTAYTEMSESETLPIEYGFQGGYMVKVWTRMTGFIPGYADIRTPYNPFTRARAKFADTGVLLDVASKCGTRDWYIANSEGGFDSWNELAVFFDTCWHKDRLVGARMQIDVELMDATGSYASDSRIITAGEPLSDWGDTLATSPTCGM